MSCARDGPDSEPKRRRNVTQLDSEFVHSLGEACAGKSPQHTGHADSKWPSHNCDPGCLENTCECRRLADADSPGGAECVAESSLQTYDEGVFAGADYQAARLGGERHRALLRGLAEPHCWGRNHLGGAVARGAACPVASEAVAPMECRVLQITHKDWHSGGAECFDDTAQIQSLAEACSKRSNDRSDSLQSDGLDGE